ncbi:hypothetical protein pb186bvf_007887 [Paramecium bursaria]
MIYISNISIIQVMEISQLKLMESRYSFALAQQFSLQLWPQFIGLNTAIVSRQINRISIQRPIICIKIDGEVIGNHLEKIKENIMMFLLPSYLLIKICQNQYTTHLNKYRMIQRSYYKAQKSKNQQNKNLGFFGKSQLIRIISVNDNMEIIWAITLYNSYK